MSENENLIYHVIKNNPGISATTSILIGKVPNFKSTYSKPANEVWDITDRLKNKNKVEEINGRLFLKEGSP